MHQHVDPKATRSETSGSLKELALQKIRESAENNDTLSTQRYCDALYRLCVLEEELSEIGGG